LKGLLTKEVFVRGMNSYHFNSKNISISDIVRTKHLGWRFSNIPHTLIIDRG
jgi:hypothetical protein